MAVRGDSLSRMLYSYLRIHRGHGEAYYFYRLICFPGREFASLSPPPDDPNGMARDVARLASEPLDGDNGALTVDVPWWRLEKQQEARQHRERAWQRRR